MDFGFVSIFAAIAYLGLLFFIAWRIERSGAKRSKPFLSSSVYALCLAVYCTAWTYYGSVGLAASSGPDFLAI